MNDEKCQSHLDPYIWTFDSPKGFSNRLNVFGIGEYVLSQYLGNGDPNDVGFFKIKGTSHNRILIGVRIYP